MKDLLKKMVIGTPVEPFARTLYAWVSTCGKYDRETLCIMDRLLKPTSNCLDIGGHKGDMLAEMVRRAPHGTHQAFEPIPESHARVAKRFPQEKFPNVTVHHVALSEEAGETTFQHVVSSPALSSLRKREVQQGEDVREIKVRTATLDSFVPDDLNIDFIKIDVEGAELQVLRGGLKTLRRCRPVVVFEHGLGGADFFGTKPDQVYDLLVFEAGLSISLMGRYLRGLPAFSRNEFVDEFVSHRNYYFIAYGS